MTLQPIKKRHTMNPSDIQNAGDALYDALVMKDRELLTVDRAEIERRLAERLPRLMERFDAMVA